MPTNPLDALPWRGDPSDLVAAAEPDPGRLLRYLAAAEPSWMSEAECRKPEHRSVDFFTDGKTKGLPPPPSRYADSAPSCSPADNGRSTQ